MTSSSESNTHFADRLKQLIHAKKSILAVGIDPRPLWFPKPLKKEFNISKTNNPSRLAAAVESFDRQLIEIAADLVPAVKVQVAFYEQLGPEGIEVFRNTLVRAQEAGLIVIGDVKRSDIGSTAEAYARAFLGTNGKESEDNNPAVPNYPPPFPCDAITVNPYFGRDGLTPFIESARNHNRGLFFLVKTSNPGSVDIQDLQSGGETVYVRVARKIADLSGAQMGECGFSDMGIVVGATQSDALGILRDFMEHHIMLTPGLGAQGGSEESVQNLTDEDGMGCLVPMARSLIYAYRDSSGDKHWKDSVRDRIRMWNNRLKPDALR